LTTEKHKNKLERKQSAQSTMYRYIYIQIHHAHP